MQGASSLGQIDITRLDLGLSCKRLGCAWLSGVGERSGSIVTSLALLVHMTRARVMRHGVQTKQGKDGTKSAHNSTLNGKMLLKYEQGIDLKHY